MRIDSPSTIAPGSSAPTAHVIRIAETLKVDPRALASEIDPDTLRRTRYPAIEEKQTDGRVQWKHPVYIPRIDIGGQEGAGTLSGKLSHPRHPRLAA